MTIHKGWAILETLFEVLERGHVFEPRREPLRQVTSRLLLSLRLVPKADKPDSLLPRTGISRVREEVVPEARSATTSTAEEAQEHHRHRRDQAEDLLTPAPQLSRSRRLFEGGLCTWVFVG